MKSFVAMLSLLAVGAASAQTPGVTATEIKLGTIQDLSGPVAAYGKEARNGMQLRVDELNEQGGVNGRKLRLFVEDSGYDPKRAVLAAQKLLNQEGIFALVGSFGTPTSVAVMPLLFERNVISFFPLSAAREMYEPFHKLKFSAASTYYDQVRLALPRLVQDKGAKKICVIYQDDDYGKDVVRATESAMQTVSMPVVEKTSYKRGATDFSSQVTRTKSAGCDLVVLATLARETVGVMSEARKTDFAPIFLTTSATYSDIVHKLGGKAVDGLYATMTVQHPYLDEASAPVRFWAAKYKTRFDEDPGVLAVYGYEWINMFIQAARRAGPQLTTDSFVKAM